MTHEDLRNAIECLVSTGHRARCALLGIRGTTSLPDWERDALVGTLHPVVDEIDDAISDFRRFLAEELARAASRAGGTPMKTVKGATL